MIKKIEDLTSKIVSSLIEKSPGISISQVETVVRRVVSVYAREVEEERLGEEIVGIGKHLYGLGFLAGTSGNISARLPDDTIIITPSGMIKGQMVEGDIVRIDLDGNIIGASSRNPSSELKMHIHSYRKRTDVQAIVHAHPPFATGFAAAGLPLDVRVLPEAVLVMGEIPLVEYGTPSTWEVPEKLDPYLAGNNVFLLENHGALTLGRNLEEASHRMETLELFAKVIVIARMLGGEKILSKENLGKLQKIM
jgi:L-fuculose-phosphate aldolase